LKLPRDLAGKKLASLLRPYGYEVTRQTGSHLRLTAVHKGKEHHITIPAHKELRVGTLHGILREIAANLEIELSDLSQELFGA
jgi:predicted RNA binding protein YcfA (HicA-like mRNA interferase family)